MSAFVREPVVKFYKNFSQGGNGAFATVTTARDADEFLRCCADEMTFVVAYQENDLNFALDALLPQICSLWAKLSGYKADDVFERRVLTAGAADPSESMVFINNPDRPTPKSA